MVIIRFEDASEGGLTARALDHAIFMHGETLTDLPGTVRDTVRCHFDREWEFRFIPKK